MHVPYLGSYIKRPPLSNARLIHYTGSDVLYEYHDHKTGQTKTINITIFEFLERFTKHIPNKGFRMIRYYGFLSNRLRAKLLPIIKTLIDDSDSKISKKNSSQPIHVTWQTLYRKTFGGNPLTCILCESKLRLGFITVGLSSFQLQMQAKNLALQKIIRI